jgi:hypothetical protein
MFAGALVTVTTPSDTVGYVSGNFKFATPKYPGADFATFHKF